MKVRKTGVVLAAAAAVLLASGFAGVVSAAEVHKIKCEGTNACKGKSACKSKDNKCKGQNACKGKGWVMMSADDCKKAGGTEMAEEHKEHHKKNK